MSMAFQSETMVSIPVNGVSLHICTYTTDVLGPTVAHTCSSRGNDDRNPPSATDGLHSSLGGWRRLRDDHSQFFFALTTAYFYVTKRDIASLVNLGSRPNLKPHSCRERNK